MYTYMYLSLSLYIYIYIYICIYTVMMIVFREFKRAGCAHPGHWDARKLVVRAAVTVAVIVVTISLTSSLPILGLVVLVM